MFVGGIGRTSSDVVLQKSESGKEYVAFGFAHDRGFGDKKETDWYNCRAFGDVAQRMAKAQIKKGSSLFLTGELELKNYVDKENITRQSVNFNILSWSFVPTGKPKNEANTEVNAEVGGEVSAEVVVSADDELPLA